VSESASGKQLLDPAGLARRPSMHNKAHLVGCESLRKKKQVQLPDPGKGEAGAAPAFVALRSFKALQAASHENVGRAYARRNCFYPRDKVGYSVQLYEGPLVGTDEGSCESIAT
jgi:hypothetical protein